jgi:NADH-quinone oxidoreductase subunit J
LLLSLGQATGAVEASYVEAALFFIAAALTVLSAWAIVISQNIVRMAVYLLLTLAGVAGLYLLMTAEFLAAIQLIVYAGGTLILIIFGVMLTSKNPWATLKIGVWERMISLAVMFAITALVIAAFILTKMPTTVEPGLQGRYEVRAIGEALIGQYIVPFEVSAVLLLVVMIGAAFMARRRAN